MKKVLLVCLGNICRSPMAEGILRHSAHDLNIPVETDSCGTSKFHSGQKPDERAIKTLQNHGIDINDLRARQFTKDDFDNFDFILVMDELNYNDIQKLSTNHQHLDKVKLMMSFAPEMRTSKVPDPYFGEMKNFEEVYGMLDVACKNFLMSIR